MRIDGRYFSDDPGDYTRGVHAMAERDDDRPVVEYRDRGGRRRRIAVFSWVINSKGLTEWITGAAVRLDGQPIWLNRARTQRRIVTLAGFSSELRHVETVGMERRPIEAGAS